MIKQGLDAYEAYRAAQPILLWGGLIGAVASGFALYKRRKTPEAYPLYIGTLSASIVAFLVGLPGSGAKAPDGTKTPGGGIVAALDARRAAFSAKDPKWADKTFARLAAQPDVAAQLNAAPMIKAMLS